MNPDELKVDEVKASSEKWVRFEDETATEATAKVPSPPLSPDLQNGYNGAILPTESVHINVGNLRSEIESGPSQAVNMRNVDLHDTANGINPSDTITTGFANGQVIVSLLPVNSRFPWITPAKFRPELVPEELMAQGLTLTVEEYVHSMEMLTNDFRFTIYNICYKRILAGWILMAFLVLVGLLLSGVQGMVIFSLGVMWLMLNSGAIFICMWIKIKLNQALERCLAQINRNFVRHNMILGLDDRGRLSCHKVNLCFIYFDTTECVKKLQEVIEREEASGRVFNRELSPEEETARRNFQERMDIDEPEIIIQGSNTVRMSRREDRPTLLLLRYAPRWVKQMVRGRLALNVDACPESGAMAPRHCALAQCLCQFIEYHLAHKPQDCQWKSGGNYMGNLYPDFWVNALD